VIAARIRAECSIRLCYDPGSMPVPLIDLRAQYEGLRHETEAAVRRVLESQRFILGAEVEALEGSVSRLTGARHGIGCASGSDAILLAVAGVLETAGIPAHAAALGRPEKDAPEVVTVPFTFFATAGSVVHAGARPRFVDIEPDAYGMDPDLAKRAIGPRTAALLPVHLFGQACDIDAIVGVAGAVPVIEDAAQAIGATVEGSDGSRGAGSIGALGCLSFFPTKNLGAAGDAGMILTSDGAMAERLRRLRVHGGRQMYHHESVGWNSRLDELQAAVLNVKMARLESWSRARASNAARYDALLEERGLSPRGLVLPPARKPGRSHIFHQYVVRVPRQGARSRDGLRERLSAAGIGSGVYYPVPLHLQPCFSWLGCARGDFPASERAANEVLALPIYPELSPDQQTEVVREMASYFGVS